MTSSPGGVRFGRAGVFDILPLRGQVLRPGRPLTSAHFEGDDHDRTRHWALWLGDEVVACATVIAAPDPLPPPDGSRATAAWQLRGMAVAPAHQGTGLGGRLLEGLHADVDAPMWCNARARAVHFYRRHGWTLTSGAFDIPDVGPHHRMAWDGAVLLHRGRHLELVRRAGWEFVRRRVASGVVGVIARTPSDALVLISQVREPLQRRVVELPAGLAGDLGDAPDEPLLAAAQRELLEETGYVSDRWRAVAEGPVSAGLTDEQVTLFLAEDAREVAQGGGDGSEDIAVHVVPVAEVRAWVEARRAAGDAVDHKVFAALAHLGR